MGDDDFYTGSPEQQWQADDVADSYADEDDFAPFDQRLVNEMGILLAHYGANVEECIRFIFNEHDFTVGCGQCGGGPVYMETCARTDRHA